MFKHRSYVKVVPLVDSVLVQGPAHHATALLRRPLIQGSAAFEITLPHQNVKSETRAAARIGISPLRFNCGKPLGSSDDSLAYGSQGVIINHSKRRKVQGFSYDDVITVVLVLGKPLHKPQKQTRKEYHNQSNKDSMVAFFKNGKKVYEQIGMPMQFFCFGVSTFQKAQVKVNYAGPFLYSQVEGVKQARWSQDCSFINRLIQEEDQQQNKQ